jgi:hypothetical protein
MWMDPSRYEQRPGYGRLETLGSIVLVVLILQVLAYQQSLATAFKVILSREVLLVGNVLGLILCVVAYIFPQFIGAWRDRKARLAQERDLTLKRKKLQEHKELMKRVQNSRSRRSM